MDHLRRAPRFAFAALATLAGVVALAVFVVLPAFATSGTVLPPSADNVTPTEVATGGQPNDCSLFTSSGQQFLDKNPKSGPVTTTASDGTKVSFRLTLNPTSAQGEPAYANQTYINVTAIGALIYDIGIKGGTDTTHYAYLSDLGHPVSADENLHAPAQATDSNGTPTQLYGISQMAICYQPTGSVSGTVYQDLNQNGTNDDSSPQSGWTVNLIDKTANASVGSATSADDGSYTIDALFTAGHTYDVCETQPASDTTTWAQTEPAPTAADLCSGNLQKGYEFTPTSSTQNISGDDFGNVTALGCTGGIPNTYQIQFATCKPNESYVFNSGTTPSGKPFVSVFPSDQTNPTLVPDVEKITWPYDPTKGQNQFDLYYTDAYPFNLSNLQAMPFCQVDPRTGPDSLTLGSNYNEIGDAGAILPSGATSCLIATTTSTTGTAGAGTYTAYVYSDLDGLRAPN